ncbi:hypothetical protein E3J62_05130 [candidate division TA06 bacterium]|uniref:DUF4845 domain-containing protein n=1 Tax=candidate division TA06 bacterium TaxID=2250710 RepID=A0A523UUE6_UNCT6|nr:MAG: hypothetical protein E3J62_05130 [candidate division TA06 bacterium]
MKRFRIGERGAGFFGIIVIVAIVGLMIFVAYKFILIKIHYMSIQEIAKHRAQYAVSYSDKSIRRDIRRKAWESGILIEEEDIQIWRDPGNKITIRFPFSDSVNLYVKKFYYDHEIDEMAPLPR